MHWEPLIFDAARAVRLTVTVSKVNEEHILTAEYNVDLSIAVYAAHAGALRTIAGKRPEPPSISPYRSSKCWDLAEQLLADWNDTAEDYTICARCKHCSPSRCSAHRIKTGRVVEG